MTGRPTARRDGRHAADGPGRGSIAARIAGSGWANALAHLAGALSAVLLLSQFLWLAPGGRFRLPLKLGLSHVATPFGAPRFEYDVVASSRTGGERVWSLRHRRGRGSREQTATYGLISRPDGLYADTALLEHVRRSRPVREGGDVDGLMESLENGELPEDYQLLLPSRLVEGKSWSFGRPGSLSRERGPSSPASGCAAPTSCASRVPRRGARWR